MYSMKFLLLVFLAIIVSSCSSNKPSFTSMSELELAEYNRGLPPEKQVFCLQEADSSTYIRRRSCQSFEDWVQQNERAAMTLDVLNSRPSFSLPSSIQDGPARN